MMSPPIGGAGGSRITGFGSNIGVLLTGMPGCDGATLAQGEPPYEPPKEKIGVVRTGAGAKPIPKLKANCVNRYAIWKIAS